MTASHDISYIAGAEDDPIEWWTAPSSRAARKMAVHHTGGYAFCDRYWWQLRATATHMRPLVCPAHGHQGISASASDDEREREHERDDCRCWDVDEGWMEHCEPDDDEAIACWRLEPREAPEVLRPALRRWRKTRRLTARAYLTVIDRPLLGVQRRWTPRTVLWGGKVERRVTTIERVLFGITWLILPADHQHISRAQLDWYEQQRREHQDRQRAQWRSRHGR